MFVQLLKLKEGLGKKCVGFCIGRAVFLIAGMYFTFKLTLKVFLISVKVFLQ